MEEGAGGVRERRLELAVDCKWRVEKGRGPTLRSMDLWIYGGT